MKLKFLTLLGLVLCLASAAKAQQNLFYNHYFINPSLYNPSFIGSNGYAELYLNYRKQWMGIQGAPTTGTLNLHLPFNYKTGLGVTAYQDEAGLLKTTTGLLSFSYQVYLGQTISDVHKIAFGLSAGVTNSRIDIDEADDINDPALANNTSSLDGQFGFHYQFQNFKLAFAIPRLFQTHTVSEENFNQPSLDNIHSTISSVSYNFKLSRISFEPMVTYRTFQNLDAQFEGLGVFKFDDIGWLGGSYREDYGAAAFLGLNVKNKIKVGYAYEFATQQTDKFGDGSHEVQVILRIGKKHFSRPQSAAKKTIQPIVDEETQEETEQRIEEEETNLEEPAVEGQAELMPMNEPIKEVEQVKSTEAAPVLPSELKTETATNLKGEGLPSGYYVVVGAFHSVQNAKSYAQTLKRAGYPASVAYQPEKNYYIVHMTNAPTIERARELRDEYRRMSRYSFKDTWILTVE